MTKDEFIATCVALHGSEIGWQSAIARRLGVSSRTMRYIVKADKPVSDGLAKDLLALLGEQAPQIVHAEWIVGDGDDGREYLMHTRHPRFRCLLVTDKDDYDLSKDGGVKYGTGDTTLCGFLWLDKMPDNITSLMEKACDFVDDL